MTNFQLTCRCQRKKVKIHKDWWSDFEYLICFVWYRRTHFPLRTRIFKHYMYYHRLKNISGYFFLEKYTTEKKNLESHFSILCSFSSVDFDMTLRMISILTMYKLNYYKRLTSGIEKKWGVKISVIVHVAFHNSFSYNLFSYVYVFKLSYVAFCILRPHIFSINPFF